MENNMNSTFEITWLNKHNSIRLSIQSSIPNLENELDLYVQWEYKGVIGH